MSTSNVGLRVRLGKRAAHMDLPVPASGRASSEALRREQNVQQE